MVGVLLLYDVTWLLVLLTCQARKIARTRNEPCADGHERSFPIESPTQSETCTIYPVKARSSETDDAATIIQSHARRRAAKRVLDRRTRERAAATTVQCFARRQLATGKVARAETAARDREIRAAREKQYVAAGQIQGFFSRRMQVNRDREDERELAVGRHQAATRLQGLARKRGAKAEARRRYTQKQEAQAKKQRETHAAAARIQTFTRRQQRAREQRMVEAEIRYKAAVKLQSVTRGYGAKMNLEKQRTMRSVESNAASKFIQDVESHVIKALVKARQVKNRQAAVEVPKHSRVQTPQNAGSTVEAEVQDAKANKRRKKLEDELAAAEEKLARTIREEERAAKKLQRTAREYNSRKRMESTRDRNCHDATTNPWGVEDSVGGDDER